MNDDKLAAIAWALALGACLMLLSSAWWVMP